MEDKKPIPVLNPEEIRVLGALIEKSRTTPEYYPLTLNSLQAACNQKTSRKPVVNYDENIIIETLDLLKKKGLIATATGGSSRVVKYKHNLAVVYPLIPAELAIIGLLLLRGPLTVGEINTNSGRMFNFETLEEVQVHLDKLATEDPVLIAQLPKRPGQKEVRYIHLLGGMPNPEDFFDDAEGSQSVHHGALEQRVIVLEQELAELKEAFEKLMKELLG
ncbi:hypothetical protein SAMN05216436_102191 [bacterium A37T11]|nr:hypothetical protein SAMN05216436_102191 [bacterium A37T11]